jgi:DNA-binding NarL/FixJ family response regulator
MIRILLADDQTLLRQGLRIILASEPDFEVVGEARDGHEAIDLAQALKPDVLLMDVRMPEVDGIEATRRLRRDGGPRVILLTTYDDEDLVLGGLRAGAAGAARVLARLAETAPEPVTAASELDLLTSREREVLGLIGAGCCNRQIASRLVIGEATVKTHVNNIFGKLGFRDRSQAVAFAYRRGIVQA